MTTSDLVSELAEEYDDDGLVIVARSTVVDDLKSREEDVSVAHEDVKPAFEDEGWAYSRHLYYHPERLPERAASVAEGFHDDGRLVVPETEFIDEVADPTPRRVEKGWQDSDVVDVLREQAAEAGWTVERATKPYSNTTRSRVFYIRPLREAIAEEHPNGRGEFSTEDIVAWYLSQSVRQEGTDDE